ncbi:MAG TPA: metalloprotease PmbA [Steroidobacteraceae bacterium]|nr:metalloprotease PmbA [Steroidobacteraceae bacterium]
MSAESQPPATVARRDLDRLVNLALEEALAQGASQAEVGVSVDTGLSVTVRLGEVETLEYQRDRGLGITVYVDHRKGSASTADLGTAAVLETVRKALSIASFTAADECSGLADAELMARGVPDLSLSHPWELTPEEAIEIARACEAAALAADARVKNSEGAALGTHRGVRVYGNSHGFLGGFESTGHSVSCAVIGVAGEEMQRDHWYTTARDWRDLEEATVVGRRSAERTAARLGSQKLATRRAPVLFAAEMARGLFGHFLAAIRGGSQYRKSSFLLGAAGQQVFPAFLQILERPHIPKGQASSAFDNEGVATRDRDLVRDGVLQGYLLGAYSARKLGLQTTGNAGGAHNLIVPSTGEDQEAMLRRMGTGLLVTEMMGQGVNIVTGDYSRGASGFWVEGGAIRYPVHEITIAGNLRDMLRGIVAVGSDVDLRGGVRTGSVLVAEMTIAGD